MTETTLPAGYAARPAAMDDLEALVAMLNVCSRELLGVDEHSLTDWRSDWNSPDFDLAGNTRVVLAPDGALVGYVGVWSPAPHLAPEQWGRVHPAHTGRGLGRYLAGWAEARARALRAGFAPTAAEPAMLQTWVNCQDSRTQALLRAQGYALVRHYLRMVIDLDAPPTPPEWPAGVRVRIFVPGADDLAVYRCWRTAFRDAHGFVERPEAEGLANWRHWFENNPEFDPSLWFVAEAGGEPVGTAFCRWQLNSDPDMAWIHTLGVLRPWRRQGLALALLRQCFGELYRRGRRRIGLGVDAASPTGATRLYEKAGMRPDLDKTEQVWEKPLQVEG